MTQRRWSLGERSWGGRALLLASSPPQRPHLLEVGLAGARSLGLHPRLPHGCLGLRQLGRSPGSPRHISRGPDPKRSSFWGHTRHLSPLCKNEKVDGRVPDVITAKSLPWLCSDFAITRSPKSMQTHQGGLPRLGASRTGSRKGRRAEGQRAEAQQAVYTFQANSI